MTHRYIPEITPPIVNLNGSHKDSLIEQNRAVYEALRIAQKNALDAFPHGRDFQTAPAGAYRQAAAEARQRCIQIEMLMMDFEALALAISEQN